MSLLIEHFANGRARFVVRLDDTEPSEAYRAIVVNDLPPSIARVRWLSAAVGCLSCAKGWAAIAPEGTNLRTLECVHCGTRDSNVVLDMWCGACGHSWRALHECDWPAAPSECPSCHAMRAEAA